MKEVDKLGTSWVPTYETLEEQLPYMDAVINESLRLFPPAWLTMREAETDLDLHGKAFHAPELMLSVLANHCSSQIALHTLKALRVSIDTA